MNEPVVNNRNIRDFTINKDVSDFLKIISALLVMFSHYFNLKAQSGLGLNTLEWCIRSQGGNVGVAVFFFLSGYGLMLSEMRSHLSAVHFFRRRFCKIYLPVLLVTALWLPISYRITPPDSDSLIIRDLLWGFKDPVLWFIKSLILLYGSFYLFTLFLNKNRTLGIVVLWIGVVFTCLVSYLSNGAFGLNSISGIPLFAVGVIAALWSSCRFRKLHPALLVLVISFAAVSLTMSFYPRFIPNMAHVFADYVIVATIILVFSRWRPTIKIPAIISLITFDIYLVHFKVLTVMKEVTPTLPIVIFMVATLLLSFALYFLRTKLIRL